MDTIFKFFVDNQEAWAIRTNSTEASQAICTELRSHLTTGKSYKGKYRALKVEGVRLTDTLTEWHVYLKERKQ